MDDPGSATEFARDHGIDGNARQYYKRDFWGKENLKFIEPHFRLEKSARIIDNIARGRDCDLLDVGCGPATLMRLLGENIHYHGIDIAIHNPAPNLIEADFLETPVKFSDRIFDIILAQGVFEYVGAFQDQKFSEISKLLAKDGKFIVSYWNFGHRNKDIYWPFSNIRPFKDFRQSLALNFHIDKFFPVSHNWHHREPGRKFIKAAQMHINMNIPFISPALAVEYFFICSPAPDRDALASPRRSLLVRVAVASRGWVANCCGGLFTCYEPVATSVNAALLRARSVASAAFTFAEVVYGVADTDVTVLPEYGVSPRREAATSRTFEMAMASRDEGDRSGRR